MLLLSLRSRSRSGMKVLLEECEDDAGIVVVLTGLLCVSMNDSRVDEDREERDQTRVSVDCVGWR